MTGAGGAGLVLPSWGAEPRGARGAQAAPDLPVLTQLFPLLSPRLQDEAMKLFFYLSSFQFRLRKICAPLATLQ